MKRSAKPKIPKAPKLPKSPHRKSLILKMVDESALKTPFFWPREMKIAQKLLEKYNDSFLMWVIPPYGKKVTSLAYFIADYGQQYLQEQYFNYKRTILDLSPKPANIVLSDTKIGEDLVIDKEPKTLKEFLNIYKNK